MFEALTVADVLERAADLIEPEGAWMQDEFSNEPPADAASIQRASCWCIAGAVARVIGRDGPSGESWLVENDIAELAGVRGVAGMVGWNDEHGRTQDQVVAKLREAAALAREQSK